VCWEVVTVTLWPLYPLNKGLDVGGVETNMCFIFLTLCKPTFILYTEEWLEELKFVCCVCLGFCKWL
jgi:hypothetical protein